MCIKDIFHTNIIDTNICDSLDGCFLHMCVEHSRIEPHSSTTHYNSIKTS